MTKAELCIVKLHRENTTYKCACAVLIAMLVEDFGEDVTADDIDTCIEHLKEIRSDLGR